MDAFLIFVWVMFVLIAFVGGGLLGYSSGKEDTKFTIAKQIIEGSKEFLQFKNGFETYNIKLEKKSHLSTHITEDKIINWEKL